MLHAATQRLTRTGIVYLVLLAAVMIAATAGFFPGAGEVGPSERVLGHPYRISMGIATLVLAVYLGAWSAVLGRVRGRWLVGLASLIAGGAVTGIVLGFAPYVLYPGDQYPVTFMWLLGGAPVGFATWLACTLGSRLTSGRHSTVAV